MPDTLQYAGSQSSRPSGRPRGLCPEVLERVARSCVRGTSMTTSALVGATLARTRRVLLVGVDDELTEDVTVAEEEEDPDPEEWEPLRSTLGEKSR